MHQHPHTNTSNTDTHGADSFFVPCEAAPLRTTLLLNTQTDTRRKRFS